VVDFDNQTILAGNQRFRAMLEKYNLDHEVDCFVPDRELTEAEREKVVVVENGHFGVWDYDLLSGFSIDIGELDLDISIPDIELPEVEQIEGQCDDDEIPEVKHSVARRGDIWLVGKHRLMNGDSTMIDDVERLMGGEKADMVFTSPPYNIGKNGFEEKSKYENDDDNKDDYQEFLNAFLNTWYIFSKYQFINLQFVSKNKLAIIKWCNDNVNRFVDLICCPKDSTLSAMEKNILNADFELVYVFGGDNRTRHIKLGKEFRGCVSNVFEMKRNRAKVESTHRAGFDVSFPLSFIEKLTCSQISVADPFMGTGTTLIACEKTNRKCYGMELDEHYCDVIIERYLKFSGRNDVYLESTGEKYLDLKEKRNA
jgi:site-specific DNA-methyltransferase (adenine-specific)